MILEVIVARPSDIEFINKTNADRIELAVMEFDGLTPSYDFIKHATEQINKPVNVIVRDWHENFVYNEEQFLKILEHIEFIKTTKANGIVFGSLTTENDISEEQLKRVVESKGHLELTFHKAFDYVNDFVKSYELLKKYKVTNVLTTAGHKFEDGVDILNKLVSLNGPKVLIGGGINKTNYIEAFKISKNIHIGSFARIDNKILNDIDVIKTNNIKKELLKND
ncbi:copper homeostasis protein [Spiroplasma sp. TIUS-1]|uniref:copper homeostasis protein CutC n=1 Tax=Spiroplasma sp. TIUS-1 TaxID=216963 RepID=UPI001396D39B|nr:copper homeostasis protein CutC [Spiroplasma sp. TIUS-1]QHX35793.1 copper homeostasis protein [Spiroplasma sp. TIUS-1]